MAGHRVSEGVLHKKTKESRNWKYLNLYRNQGCPHLSSDGVEANCYTDYEDYA